MALPENVQKWVDALRSGEYEQAEEVLRAGDPDTGNYSYCCLGVACDISGVGRWSVGGDYLCDKDESSTSLPIDVAEWLGIDMERGQWNEGSLPDTLLTAMNDNGATFEQIADAIVENADYLFTKEVT